jgi:hypothetical protein
MMTLRNMREKRRVRIGYSAEPTDYFTGEANQHRQHKHTKGYHYPDGDDHCTKIEFDAVNVTRS